MKKAIIKILLMIITTIVFASQDGLSKYLATEYNVYMVVMIRYWFFAAFVISVSSQKTGGIKRVAKTKSPILQIFRSLILVAEMCITILAFTLLGLAETHAIFASYPLIIAMLSGPILGEYVGWRRWLAICVGFIGILIILNPGNGIFSPYALVPLVGAILFALYGLLTRYVGQYDNSNTSFFLDWCCRIYCNDHYWIELLGPGIKIRLEYNVASVCIWSSRSLSIN